jgi:hypothetical protein
LESIYPDDCEIDIILDGGRSISDFSIGPLIDCGHVTDSHILLDGGKSYEFHPIEQSTYLILDGGKSREFETNDKKINLENSKKVICN